MNWENDVASTVGRAVKKALIILGIIAIVLFIFGGGLLYTVQEGEEAVVTQFGAVIRTDSPGGPYFKIPFIQRARKVDVTTRGMGIGYRMTEDGKEETDEDGVMITSDFNFLNIDFYLESRVNDPVAYLFNADDPEETLRQIALASIRSTVSDFTVDEAITTEKDAIQKNVKERIAASLKKQDIGIQIVNVMVQDSEPPTKEIQAEFKAVENAKQGMESTINEAEKYKNEQIPQAEAEADKLIQQAEAYKAQRIAEAEGQVATFNALYEGYKAAPLATKKRIFYETMEDVLPNLRVIIDNGGTQTMLPLEPFSTVNANVKEDK